MAQKIHDHRDEHILRKFFDALYEITPDNFIHLYQSIPKSIKRMVFSMAISGVLILIVFQLAQMGVAEVQWANRTPLVDRVMAPFNVEGRAVPAIDLTLVEDRTLPMVDGAALETERQLAVEAANAEALVTAQAAYDAAVASGEIQPEAAVVEEVPVAEEGAVAEDGTVVEAVPVAEEAAVAEPVKTVADFMPEVDEFAIRMAIQPETDQGYFTVIPGFMNYLRTYVYDNVQTHASQTCVLFVEADAETLPCGLEATPVFVEAGDFVDAENNLIRIMAVRYEDTEIAHEAMKDLYVHSHRVGVMGNYAVSSVRSVQYFFGLNNGWRVFTWSHGEWIYSISAEDLTVIEDFARAFPY